MNIVKPHFVGEEMMLLKSGARPAATRDRPPRPLQPRTRGIAIVARDLRCSRPRGEEERTRLNKATMLLGVMHDSMQAGDNLANQSIRQKEFMAVPTARSEYESRQSVFKISSLSHELFMA